MNRPKGVPGSDDARVFRQLEAFDDLIESIGRWTEAFPQWPPARRIAAEWADVGPRLAAMRDELTRVLVVGVIGGTGTGKSTLVNALAGSDVSPAGDVARPTTKSPVVVAGSDVECPWLPIERWGARLVRSGSPAVAGIVLVDCPDPDTQPDAANEPSSAEGRSSRPSDANRNRDLLEQVLPECDVLLLVSTAQKYRSWVVAREVADFAPGRPLLFVQTHAARDVDIRDDWRKELESQGFDVPRIHRVDGVEAIRRGSLGLPPDEGFAELIASIETELAGRAARRVRRTGASDLAAWFFRQVRHSIDGVREPVAELAGGVERERVRLEAVLASSLATQLKASRHDWQRLVVGDLLDSWQGGPFAAFVQAVAAVGALWPRIRSAGGGLVGRVLAGRMPPGGTADRPTARSPDAIGELGLAEAEIEQSRSILVGLAARAKLAPPLVGKARLADDAIGPISSEVLSRAHDWLSRGVGRLVEDRRCRGSSKLLRTLCEGVFTALLVSVLGRAGWSFFHDRLWLGMQTDTSGFLWEAVFWILVCGLLLRFLVVASVRRGLDRDIDSLVSRLPEARCVDPVIDDFSIVARNAAAYIAEGDRLTSEADSLTMKMAEPSVALGRLRRDSPVRGES